MTSDATVVARYDAAERAAVEQTLRKLVRRQGILLLVLAVVWGLITLLPVVAVATEAGDVGGALVLSMMFAVPIAIGALGVRQLRRQFHLPEVAVTITPTAVLFPRSGPGRERAPRSSPRLVCSRRHGWCSPGRTVARGAGAWSPPAISTSMPG
jgi:hypothetical protein